MEARKTKKTKTKQEIHINTSSFQRGKEKKITHVLSYIQKIQPVINYAAHAIYNNCTQEKKNVVDGERESQRKKDHCSSPLKPDSHRSSTQLMKIKIKEIMEL